MSFQAYIDNIKTKTGKGPEDFKKLAEKKGLLKGDVKAGEIISWLKKDFKLGHGHAMAIYAVFKGVKEKKEPVKESISKHFTGNKASWQPVFESLLKSVNEFGDDVKISPASSYLSILRGSRKMAIVQVGAKFLDIGIKLKGVASTKRFQSAGTWNAMMTHRVRIASGEKIDKEVIDWLRSAYEQNA